MKLSCCGDDCDRCPRYEATQNNDTLGLEALAVLWYELGWRDQVLPLEAMQCYGCATVPTCSLGVRDCARSKQLENCGQCTEFPCPTMDKIITRSELNAEICRTKCDPKLFNALNDSFFKKRDYLLEEQRRSKQ